MVVKLVWKDWMFRVILCVVVWWENLCCGCVRSFISRGGYVGRFGSGVMYCGWVCVVVIF